MNYTQSLDNVVHPGTGNRMHTDTAAVGTAQSAKDTNSVIWSLMEVVKAANKVGVTFDPDNPASYRVLRDSIIALVEARVGDYALDTGVANAYVVAVDPVITAYPAKSFDVKFKVAHAANGPSTLDAGPGPRPLVRNDGVALIDGDLPVDTLVGATYDPATNKFWINSQVTAQSLTKVAADLLYVAKTDGRFIKGSQTFTATGTFTVPAGVTEVIVEVWGGGGGGGGGASTANGGSGGGGAGYSRKRITGLVPAATIAVTVGLGGTAGPYGLNGGAGGSSTFGAYCSATGGAGGLCLASSTPATIGGTGAGGDFNLDGDCSDPCEFSSGSNGGSAAQGGAGGIAGYSSNGGIGKVPGGGGGGGDKSSSGAEVGGAGAPGMVIVRWGY